MEEAYIRLKPELDINDLLKIDPAVLEMIAFTSDYCIKYNLPCLVTSLREEVEGRKFSTHRDGRAVDFSCRGWNDFHIARFQHEFRTHFKGKGAYNRAGTVRPIVWHKIPGGASHFHMQVRRRDEDGAYS